MRRRKERRGDERRGERGSGVKELTQSSRVKKDDQTAAQHGWNRQCFLCLQHYSKPDRRDGREVD